MGDGITLPRTNVWWDGGTFRTSFCLPAVISGLCVHLWAILLRKVIQVKLNCQWNQMAVLLNLGWFFDEIGHSGVLIVSRFWFTDIHAACSNPGATLAHWGRDKMAAISKTIISKAFSWMKIFVFWLIFHWIVFLRVTLAIFQHRFR